MKLKIAIIGSGFGQYALLPAFLGVKNCEVVALCGTQKPELKDTHQWIGSKKIYSDWQTLLEKESLDALVVAVPPRAQYTIVKAAIKKGLHIFAEKPLATSVAEARELLSLAQKMQIVHGIDFMLPEIAAWRKVKELLEKKTFGKLTHISAEWNFLSYDIKNKKKTWKTDAAEGGGALSFYFSHGLHYLEYFAGEITKIKSSFTYSPESLNGGEVGVDMIFRYTNGVTGTAHVCCNYRGPATHKLIFECERGAITLQSKGEVVASGFTLETCSEGKVKMVPVKKEHDRLGENERVKIVRKIADRFVRSCMHKQKMVPSFQDGLRVQTLIEKIRSEKI